MKRVVFLFLLFFLVQLKAEIILQMQWYPQAQFAGYIMAYKKGFFQEKDLNVTLLFSTGDQILLEELAKGKIDYVSAWLSEAISRNREGDLINIVQVLQKSSIMIVADKAKEIDKPRDLNGKKLSLWKGNFTVPLEAFIDKYNLDYQSVPSSYNIDMFLSGACDAASVMYYNEFYKIYLAGVDFADLTSFPFSEDPKLNFPEDGIYVTKDYYDQHKDETKLMREAILKGWRYAADNQEETIRTVLKYCDDYKLRTNYAQQKWMLEKILAAMIGNTKLDKAQIGVLQPRDYQRVNNELKRQKLIDKTIPYLDFFKGDYND